MNMEVEAPIDGGPITALDHVNLTIPDGQTVVLIGPSGCGKSTLLRVVAGLTDFTGRVFYDDQDMRDVSPADRYIGMVFQNYALYPHFENKGNLGFFFRMRKRPQKEAEERIRITSEIMGIGFDELLPRKPGTLSGGQQQRVAIARALVRKPDLFLFDEPLSNLDAKLRAQTRVEIKRLLCRFYITAIYATHDQVEAISLGDQIAVLRAGRVEQMGTHQELWDRPANAFVASFFGRPAMNLFPKGIVADGVLQVGRIAIPLPDAIKTKVHSGQTLIAGVRPDVARCVTGDQCDPDSVLLRGTVKIVEPDFARQTQVVYAHTGDFSYTAVGPLDTMLNTEDPVAFAFPVEQFYFFDGESEQRI
jgi:ABC-type sugar transport system ATPase subunit